MSHPTLVVSRIKIKRKRDVRFLHFLAKNNNLIRNIK